jgi:hypothetical protein
VSKPVDPDQLIATVSTATAARPARPVRKGAARAGTRTRRRRSEKA